MKNRQLTPISDETLGANARRLVILIPGMGSDHKSWKVLVKRLQQETGYRPDEAQWMSFDHGIHVLSPGPIRPLLLRDPHQAGNLESLTLALRNLIDGQWAEHKLKTGKDYEDVVLIGHSFGGLIARRVYLLAADAVPRQNPSPWGERVSRIVLFAAVNRGFNLKRLNWFLNMGAWLARISSRRIFYMEDVLLGSDFVTNLRIDWIRHFSALSGQWPVDTTEAGGQRTRIPLVVQLLGDEDGILSREDSKDVLAFTNSHYIEIASATHGNLYRLEPTYAPDPDARYAVLREAFVGDPEKMRTSIALRPLPSPYKRVVMLLHGIRASNVDAWIDGLKSKLKAKDSLETHVVTPTYGYFSALRFALPFVRRRNIPIFRDEYTEQLAKNPQAEFNIIAHSNGSYMLGWSLERTPGMRFQNIVLAGSALPPEQDWDTLMQPDARGNRQVGRVLNERANHDIPIGILCSALRGIGMRDIGPAGFSGFVNASTFEVAYHPGGHGDALIPKNQDRLIDFVLGGNPPEPSWLLEKPFLFGGLSRAAPYLIWLILIGLLGLVYGIAFPGRMFNRKHTSRLLAGFLAVLTALDSL